jgi:hypothetical protein
MLKAEHWRVFDNRVQRGVFESNREEVTQSRRKVSNEELHNSYC